MKTLRTALIMTVAIIGLAAVSPVYALNLGTNITIPDMVSEGTGWYGAQEDNEVEPGNWTGQQHDVEGFFVNENFELSMVGGYEFHWAGADQGAIFFDFTGDISYGLDNEGSGAGNSEVLNTFGYDLGLVLNFDTMQYNAYLLDEQSILKTVEYSDNDESNAWQIKEGEGELLGSFAFTHYDELTDAEVGGLLGGEHNAVVIDLTVLNAALNGQYDFTQEFYAHYTMKCGNDNLMGYYDPSLAVPEPSTLLLLGLGVLGLLPLSRKYRR